MSTAWKNENREVKRHLFLSAIQERSSKKNQKTSAVWYRALIAVN